MIDDKLKENILALYPEYDVVYGPYLRKDNRRIISLSKKGKDGSTARQYARVLLEVKLGRRFHNNETVDHIDGDKTNDDLNNLQILSKEDNAGKAAIRLKEVFSECLLCNKTFQLSRDQIYGKKRGKVGPFCSRQCSGTYGNIIQNGGSKLEGKEFTPTYYKIQDLVP